jgi:hypothetical protein
MENARVTFYKIERCGLYQIGADTSSLGGVSDFLLQLRVWVSKGDKPLDETCTYAIEDSEDVGRTFCYDITSNDSTGDFLLTTWNETPSHKGRVAAVQAKSRVGSANVEFTNLPKDSIPGYATYFWFLPSLSVYATIQFTHRLNGKKSLEKYLREFISKFSDYAIVSDMGSADFNIVGYTDNAGDTALHLHSQFMSSMIKKPGQIDYILRRARQIRKISRHNRLLPSLPHHQEFWQKALVVLGLKENQQLDAPVNFAYEFSLTPTEAELQEIIRNWDHHHDLKWDDIGFTFQGEQKIQWLSHSLARSDYNLAVKRLNEEIIDAKSLLSELTLKRQDILALLA